MHNHFRRTAAFIVCLALVFGLFPVTAAAEGLSFTDVPETAWFYEDVRMAVESGLLHGRSQTRYEPEGSLTCAEAVKLAACIHRLSKDEPPVFEAGTPWYQPYAAYAKDNAIISGDLGWERAITRADFMDVFSRAIADTAARSMRLEAKNRVEDGGIPDVSQRDSRAAAIYTLYRAGIVQGVDGSGACMPDKTILRSETAAILTRMLHPEQRLSFSLYRRESTVIPVWPEAPEPDEKPDDKPETPFSVITDDYSSLDQIYSCSDVTMLGVDTGSPDAVGDDARLLRYGCAAQSYDMRTNAPICHAELTAYYHPSILEDGREPIRLTFSASADGSSWTAVPAEAAEQENAAGTDWLNYRYVMDAFPEDAVYIRVHLPAGAAWELQIGELSLTVQTETGAFVQPPPATLDNLHAALAAYEQQLQQLREGDRIGDLIPGAKTEFENYLREAKRAMDGFTGQTPAREILILESTLKRAYETMLTRVQKAGNADAVKAAAAQARSLAAQCMEGSQPGQYAQGAKEELLRAADAAEQAAAAEGLTQSGVNEIAGTLRTAMCRFAEKKVMPEADTSAFSTFITRQKDTLMDGTSEFRFVSVNNSSTWSVQYPSWKNDVTMRAPTAYEQADVLKTVNALGGQVLRTYPFPIEGGTATDGPGATWLLSADGSCSEEKFQVVDRMLALANQYGVRLVIPFIDTWAHHGGIEQFTAIYGKKTSAFFTDRTVIDGFKAYLKTILTRVNSVTGVPYYEDKAILAWETGNELSALDAWTEEIAAYIKSIDPYHLVMDGNFGVSDAAVMDPNVDILSNHYYNAASESDYAGRYLHDAWKTAQNKAFVVGEFGLADNSSQKALLEAVVENKTSGCMIWCLNGHSEDGGFYNAGDLHWPGKNENDRELMRYVREKAFEIQGKNVPALQAPEAPVLNAIGTQFEISWKGAVGAESYRLLRSEAIDGDYVTIAGRLAEGIGLAYAPAADTTAQAGKTYYYAMEAVNAAGVSAMSEPVEFHVTSAVDIRVLRALIDQANALLENGNEADYDSGAFPLLRRAVHFAATELTNPSVLQAQADITRAENSLRAAIEDFHARALLANRPILTDNFDDLSKPEEASENLILMDSEGAFPTRKSRLVRSNSEDGYLVYHTQEAVRELRVVSFHWPNLVSAGFIRLSVSTDAQDYTALTNVQTEVTDNGGSYWKTVTYSAAELPEQVHYVRIELVNPSGSSYWTPYLEQVRLYGAHTQQRSELYSVDFSDGFGSAAAETDNVVVDSNWNSIKVHPAFGHCVRLSAASASTGYVVYDVRKLKPGGTLEQLTVWCSRASSNSLYPQTGISFSADGSTYTPAAVSQRLLQNENWSDRWEVQELTVLEIPAGTRYVKLTLQITNPGYLWEAHLLGADLWISAG